MRPLESGMQLRAYRLERRIGRGGEGDVWLALNMGGEPVAIKARPHTDDRDAQRFRSEFARLRTLRIPGVVRVVDVGADQGYLFFAMEVAEGVPFDQFAAGIENTQKRIVRVCAAGAQVARALASIHRLGLAHRDIKPANVHVQEGPDEARLAAMVLDFGTHHFGNSSDDTGVIRGTPAYMAPEQRLGMPHDHRVDIHSLGTVLHEAIRGEQAHKTPPGQRRPSLAGLGPAIPMILAELVDRMLDLDPSNRPSAEETEAVLQSIADKDPFPSATWPKPVFVGANVEPLLQQSRLVHGGLGDGVSRYIATARWHWYRKGYPSVMGRCDSSKPYSAWVSILAQLFGQRTAVERAVLAGAEGATLHGIWPKIPLPCENPAIHVPEQEVAANAIAAVLNRCAPIAIIIHDMHDADPGTEQTIPLVLQALDKKNRLWVTSHHANANLPSTTLPPWTQETHDNGWRELLQQRVPIPPLARNGQEFLRMAWRALAEERNEPEILDPFPPSLQRLSVLRQPFPHAVAVQMAPDLNLWVDEGQLRVVSEASEEQSARMRFASEANRALAHSELSDESEAHLLAALAWGRFPEDDEAVIERVKHLLTAKQAKPEDVIAVVQQEVTNEHPAQVRRWLDLLRLHLGNKQFDARAIVFEARYAQLYSQLFIAPQTIHLDDIRELAVQADNTTRRAAVAHIKLAHALRTGESTDVIHQGRHWAMSISQSHPVLAARMYREIAQARIGTHQNQAAIRDIRKALHLSRIGAESSGDGLHEDTTQTEISASGPITRLTQPEIDAATTYSAALVFSGQPEQASKLCQTMYRRCHRTGRHRGSAAFLINQAMAMHRLGQRTQATHALAEARAIQHNHGDSRLFAKQAVLAARLAVERADLSAATILLDEGITASIGIDDAALLGEAWACALDLATQTGDLTEARRALSTYGHPNAWSSRDHWPAALARWHWTRGNLEKALAATEEKREGYGGACIQAERSRLLLIHGDQDAAVQSANGLLRHPGAAQYPELHLFARLIIGAATQEKDPPFLRHIEHTRQSRWVHLYLGALHLDAIRRRCRGENVMPILRKLGARSIDLSHGMYEALANPKGW